MPKKHQQRRAREEVGRNSPEHSTVITTGTYKKQETYHKEAAEHKDPGAHPPAAKVPPSVDTSAGLTHEADSRAREEDRERRSGSDSNASKHRKGSRLHDNDKTEKQQPHREAGEDFAHDLETAHRPAEELGLGQPDVVGYENSVYDIKELHGKLADLTDDELKSLVVLPVGTRLEQGAKYIDLQHLEQGEFVARADMVAGPDNYYVPKKETDYVLWNRLNQVTEPARLDESEPMDSR